MSADEQDLAHLSSAERRSLLDDLMQAAQQLETTVVSDGQRRLWLQNRLAPDSPAYNVARCYRIRGPLDVRAMRAAWQRVVVRHAVLRTTFADDGGSPIPVVAQNPADPVFVVDVGEDGYRAAIRAYERDAITPFDLREGPLLRCGVYRLSDDEWYLTLVMHHVVTDGGSMPTLLHELSEHYRSELQGDTPRVPPNPLQYEEHARRQARRSQEEPTRSSLKRWRERLQPLPPPLDLPSDAPRPAERSGRGGTLPFNWGEPLAQSALRLSRERAATPFMILLAGFAAWLRRITGNDAVVIGSPVAGRPDADLDDAIGFFVNTLPLRVDLSSDPSFDELLSRVRRSCLDAFEDQDVPFEQIVDAVSPSHAPGRNPLFDVMLVVQSVPEPALELTGTTSSAVTTENLTAKFDLTLCLETTSPTWSGWLEYDADQYLPETCRAMLDQMRTLVTAALASPADHVSTLPVDPGERADIAPAPDPTECVADMVRARAEVEPGAFAVEWDGDVLTYRELVAWAEGIARLLSTTTEPSSSVAVRLPAGGAQIAAVLGAMMAHRPVMLLDPGAAPQGAESQLRALAPQCMVVEGDFADDELVSWYRRQLGGAVVDGAALGGARGSSASPAGRVVETPPDATAYVVFTSGSTNRPAGIVQPHQAFSSLVEWMAQTFDFRAGCRVAQWAAPGYDAGLCEIFATLVGGGTVVPVPPGIRTDGAATARWLCENDIDMLQTVPSFAREVLAAVERTDSGPRPSLSVLMLAGEPLPGEMASRLLEALPGLRLANLYGPTETTLATWHEVRSASRGVVPIGSPIPGRQVQVLDDRGLPCPTGATGEIVVSGSGLASGYLDVEARPGAFETGAGGERLYRTGDLGRRRWDGALEFRGRRDGMVKLHGVRVELAEVEAVLSAHPSVRSCALVPHRDADGLTSAITACVVPEDGTSLHTQEWRAHLRRHFVEGILPNRFVLIDSIPRNGGSKIDRRALALAVDGLMDEPPDERPMSVTEQAVAGIWAEVLKRVHVPRDLGFFAAGGNSLLAPRVLYLVHDRLGVEVPLRQFFADPTVAGLAQVIERGGAEDDLADLMREITALTDDEARRLLQEHEEEQ